MNRWSSLVLIVAMCVAQGAHANQVQPTPPPATPPSDQPPAPSDPAPAPPPEPAIQPTPAPGTQAPTQAPTETPTEVPTAPPSYVTQTTPAPVSVTAPPAPVGPTPGAETHDGFFLRVALGLGYSTWVKQLPTGLDEELGLPVTGGNVRADGGGGALELAIGGMIADNLALHGTLFIVGVGDPALSTSTGELPKVDGRNLSAAGLGVGITYYLMPINVYLSGSLAIAGIALAPGRKQDPLGSKGGVGLELMAGKDWWIGDDWGLGAAVQLVVVSASDPEERSSVVALSLMGALTYN